jgi:hypothetical protein
MYSSINHWKYTAGMSDLQKKTLSLPCVFILCIIEVGRRCVENYTSWRCLRLCQFSERYLLQELLFCETCDTVFCTLCTGGSHSTSGSSCEHTIIPFSIAIKRMSEILLYKANECISKVRIHCNLNLFSHVSANCEFCPWVKLTFEFKLQPGAWGL